MRTQAEPGHEAAYSAFRNGSSGTSEGEAADGGRYGSTPFYFEQNVGQADEDFDFVARGPGYTLGLSATEAVFSLASRERQRPEVDLDVGCVKSSLTHQDLGAAVRLRGLDTPYQPTQCSPSLSEPRPLGSDLGVPLVANAPGSPDPSAPHSSLLTHDSLVRMQIVGGNVAAPATGTDQLVTKINYFLGNDPNEWHSNVLTFGKVQYDDVYPGIDLVYYSVPPSPSGRGDGGEGALEYDFIVSPGADPNQIALTFSGADSVEIDANGDLVLQTGDTQIRQNAPSIYQEVNGNRQQVAGEFRIQNSECSGSTNYCLLTTDYSSATAVYFDVGDYDQTRPLVIDPMVVSYSTYLGGPNYDYGRDIAVDKFGNAYITGEAGSDFPLVNPAQQYAGGKDVFVSKFSPDGQSLLYSTYIGGNQFDSTSSIAVDFKGAAYITGGTQSASFPTTPDALQVTNPQGMCLGGIPCPSGFITKLGPNGDSLVYSTFLGAGGSAEAGGGIAVDVAGNAYVMGMTNSAYFPTVNAVQPTFGGGGCNQGAFFYPCFDNFVAKLNPTGSALIYSTYLGGNRDEAHFFIELGDLAIDPAGHAYITGYTDSSNFPTFNAIQPTKNLNRDAYVTKLSPDGSAFVYSTFLGGGDNGEMGNGIAADSTGNAYATGVTHSADFPTTPGALQTIKNDDGSVYVSKIQPDGSGFAYSTFLGGSKNEEGDAIAVDGAGSAYVTGWTYSLDFPVNGAFQPTHGAGDTDAFLTRLSPAGNALVYSTYLGGSGTSDNGNDGGHGIGFDAIGNTYVVGTTNSTDFPLVRPFQSENSGRRDVFVTKVSRLLRESATAQPL